MTQKVQLTPLNISNKNLISGIDYPPPLNHARNQVFFNSQNILLFLQSHLKSNYVNYFVSRLVH